MKKRIFFLLLAFILLLASCGENTEVSHTESDTEKVSIPEESVPADGSLPDIDIDISLPEDTSSNPAPEVGGTAQEGKWGKYTFISEENGLTVAGIYTTEQVNEFNQKRENGEWFVVTEEDLRFLLDAR